MAAFRTSLRVSFVSGALLGFASLVFAPAAMAFSFDIMGISGALDSQLTIGGMWRVEDRDDELIGKSNLNPGLCLRRVDDAGTIRGDGCNSTSDASLNREFVSAPGSFSPNGDDGNLNYDKGDLVSAAVKLTSDLSFSLWKFDFFIRGLYYFDDENHDAVDNHPDTTFQPAETKRPDIVDRLSGTDADILDAYVSFYVPFFGDREISVKVGDQVVNWGESTFLLLNSINYINAPSAPRLRTPGFDVKELFIPTGMVVLGAELFPNFSTEMFYNYEFDPAIPDPVGTFFSSADTIVPGGTYAALSFSKAPEDPDQIYDPSQNPDDATGQLSNSSRSIKIRDAVRPDDEGGQYGIKLAYFAENLNGGTEFGLYYMNLISRFPIASFIAADASCAVNATDVPTFIAGCGLPGSGSFGTLGFSAEALPVETVEIFAEYPEDIQLYGFSFNTTVGDWAWSGEIAYRPNQPFQIHSTDLTLAALQPAFPATDIDVPLVAVIPGRRSAVPDFVQTQFRGSTASGFTNLAVAPNSYVRGYESLKSWNVGNTWLNTLGGGHWASSFFKADQIVVLFEYGFNYIEEFPSLHELQFNASGTDTHFSAGADGTAGHSELGAPCIGQGANASACRQNPTIEDSQNFPDRFSWGTRNIFLLRYQDALFGANLEPLVGIFADWNGIGPGPGNNFTEGNRTYILGLRGDYLNKYSAEFRYTILDGNGINNALSDRDNVFLYLGYEF